jgi:hypothetical protein
VLCPASAFLHTRGSDARTGAAAAVEAGVCVCVCVCVCVLGGRGGAAVVVALEVVEISQAPCAFAARAHRLAAV